jgi:hypothetical protein
MKPGPAHHSNVRAGLLRHIAIAQVKDEVSCPGGTAAVKMVHVMDAYAPEGHTAPRPYETRQPYLKRDQPTQQISHNNWSFH